MTGAASSSPVSEALRRSGAWNGDTPAPRRPVRPRRPRRPRPSRRRRICGRSGAEAIPFLGMNSIAGDAGKRYGVGFRFGSLFGGRFAQNWSVNGEMVLDFLNTNSIPGLDTERLERRPRRGAALRGRVRPVARPEVARRVVQLHLARAAQGRASTPGMEMCGTSGLAVTEDVRISLAALL